LIQTKPFNFVSLDEIENNISFYKDFFIKEGLMVFRGANLSTNDHFIFHEILCKYFGAYKEENSNGYIEDHSRVVDSLKKDANEVVHRRHGST
jgi:hypothetical protein